MSRAIRLSSVFGSVCRAWHAIITAGRSGATVASRERVFTQGGGAGDSSAWSLEGTGAENAHDEAPR